VGDLAFRLVPLRVKMNIGLNAMAKVFNMVSDQKTNVYDHKEWFWYAVEQCPACWGREHVTVPICYTQVGLLQEGLRWLSNGREFKVEEVQCLAMGHDRCLFRVNKEPVR
jgi:predicted hydrocarbon binding protein